MRLFRFTLVFVLAMNGFGNTFASECELADHLEKLESKNTNNKAREDSLKLVLKNSLFDRDDEKKVGALLELLDFESSRKNAEDALEAFLESTRPAPAQNFARERRASALSAILQNKRFAKYADKIRHILLIEFPETVAAKKLDSQILSAANWVERLESLSEKNENSIILDEFVKRERDLKKANLLTCKVQYLIGKAYRKNRNYTEAIQTLDRVATKCVGVEKRDALFLLTRLAAIVPKSANLVYFDRFEKEFSNHSYFDDALIFKSSALESLGRAKESQKVLQQITMLKTASDMRFEAYFRLAFMYAIAGNSNEAIKILKESLAHREAGKMSPAEKDRALYWMARLQLIPDVTKLNPPTAHSQLSEAEAILNSLAESDRPTIYSWLAAGIMKRAFPKVVKTPLERSEKDEHFRHPLLDPIFCLARSGRVQDAQRFIENLSPYELEPKDRMFVARALNRLGMHSESFRFATASPLSGADNRFYLFPRPYEKTVESAVAKIEIPKNLLFGLMREESRFDSRVVSWAGARGLLQLMPNVAKLEAVSLGMKDISEEDMLDPKINILLSAEHLKGMKQELRHPLLVVAAYNAGLYRVKKWRDDYGSKIALDTFIESIPLPETRNYVKRVAESWINYSHIYSEDDAFLKNFETSSKI